MGTPTDVEMQRLFENFETTHLLAAVDKIDELRDYLADGEHYAPPELRTDLLKLHEFAVPVVNNGNKRQALAMFDLASDIQDQLAEMEEALRFVKRTIDSLMINCPKSLYD